MPVGPSPARTAADLAVVVLLVAAVVAVAAHAPSHLYAYAQLKRVSSAIAMLQRGGEHWLLPVNQTGGIASKPQLYPWLLAAALKLTHRYDDFVFRLPNALAGLLTAVMVYFLARRWYGRRVGLLAGCLWATMLHMGRMLYLASTDMLLTASITASVLCADRLLFHRAGSRHRWKWAVGLWASMIAGALAKGWGLVNFVLVGGVLGLAAVVEPGFGALRAVAGPWRKCVLLVRLVLRRIRRAMRATRFGWGMLAMLAALVPVWVGMYLVGGRAFRDLIYYEFFQRATGVGSHAPKGSSVPLVLHLLYYAMPASIFALGALCLVPPRRWLSRSGPLWLPLCWVLAVVVPFSLAHGFRPDYLLPCYGAVAMLGAWGVEELLRRGRGGGWMVRICRHVFAATAVAICAAVAALAAAYVHRPLLRGNLREALPLPFRFSQASWWALHALVPAGVVAGGLAVIWSLRWRLRRLTAVAAAAMLGVFFLHTHAISRHAQTADGEAMRAFALDARPVVGADEIAVLRAVKLSVEAYLGRLAAQVVGPEEINASGARWLITCDRGLAEIGAYRVDANGPYVIKARIPAGEGTATRKLRIRTLPFDLGRPRAVSRPVQSQNWGRVFLIELRRPVRVSGEPLVSAWESGRRDDDEDE